MTYQLQAASVDATGSSTAQDMWTGIVAALIVAFLTAFAFAELARRYPNAGSGSAYYFAEKAFLDREEPAHRRWARLAKFITGWAAHLFYWVYPGVMVAFMTVLITYITSQFGLSIPIGVRSSLHGVFCFGWLYCDARRNGSPQPASSSTSFNCLRWSFSVLWQFYFASSTL
jgi:amino acid transporter